MNLNENVNIPLPQDLLDKYRHVEQEFMSGLYQTNPAKAFSLWNDLYKEVIQRQPTGKRYHKGGEVHNMGICKLFLMSPIDSMNCFMLGFIEDILSTKTESGTSPEDAPGAQNLKNIFKITEEQFKLIQTFVKELMTELGVIQDPQIVLDKLEKSGVKNPMEKSARGFDINIKRNSYPIKEIPGDWGNRVFIGGDYVNYFYVINILKPLIIQSNKFVPIIASECIKPDEMSIREHALLLLHNCKYAIFDISGRGGQLIEIERTFDYRTKAYYICAEGQQPTAMLDYLKNDIQYFKHIDIDLPSTINKLLSLF